MSIERSQDRYALKIHLRSDAIAQALYDIDAEITGLEAHRAKTQAIKQRMRQKLLTGKRRLIESNHA